MPTVDHASGDGPTSGSSVGSLRVALDLAEFGSRAREQRYRREHPAATDDDVAAFMAAWWSERPGAPAGDSAGRPLSI